MNIAFKTLGLTAQATKDEVKKAYRILALKCHPDHREDKEQAALEFQQLTEAYNQAYKIAPKHRTDDVWGYPRIFRQRVRMTVLNYELRQPQVIRQVAIDRNAKNRGGYITFIINEDFEQEIFLEKETLNNTVLQFPYKGTTVYTIIQFSAVY